MFQMTNESDQRKFISSTDRITLELLRKYLFYNPWTGWFTWTRPISNRVRIGEIAGSLHNSGYIVIRIHRIDYPAHVLAWFYIHGVWANIDHEDRNGYNNRLSNLRVATASQQNHNKKVYANNKLGVKGVKLTKSGRYEANIQVNHVQTYLGTFDTIEEASEAYSIAARKHYGQFAKS